MRYKICKRYFIGIGMNDAETHEQIIDTNDVIKKIVNCCKTYNESFSISQVNGGYINKQGKYIEENSIIVAIIDPKNKKCVYKIAKDLCSALNQECVTITSDHVKRMLVTKNSK